MGPSQLKRILIVEDDLALKPFWESVLQRCFKNWELEWAISGEEAKNIIQRSREEYRPFSLVISDIFLAGADTGLDLMTSDEFIQSKAKFILVSVVNEEKVKENYYDIICNNTVMTKPLNAPECARTIKEVLHRVS